MMPERRNYYLARTTVAMIVIVFVVLGQLRDESGVVQVRIDIDKAEKLLPVAMGGFEMAFDHKFQVPPMPETKWKQGYLTTNATACKLKIVFYNRVAKCGSSSMLTFLDRKSARNHNFVLKKMPARYWMRDWELLDAASGRLTQRLERRVLRFLDKHVLPDQRVQKVKKVVVVGHFPFVDFSQIQSEQFTFQYAYVNLIREPISRMVSHYDYIRWGSHRPLEWRKKAQKAHGNLTVEACFQNVTCRDLELRPFGSLITAALCGFQPSPCHHSIFGAAKHLGTNYALVGTLKHIAKFHQALEEQFPDFFGSHPDQRDTIDHNNEGGSISTRQVIESFPPKLLQNLSKITQSDENIYRAVQLVFKV